MERGFTEVYKNRQTFVRDLGIVNSLRSLIVFYFPNCLKFHDNVFITNEIRYKLRIQLVMMIDSIDRLFANIRNTLFFKLNLQCILIDFLGKATTKKPVNSHCCSHYLICFFFEKNIHL